MPVPAISVENLSKRYLVGHQTERSYTALRDVIGRELRNLGRKAWDIFHGRQIVLGDSIEEYWALKDVSFEVREGEVLGIIGRNGAGKSTLLKILSRITEPSAGRVTLRGRVASLLEVGTGFHPELTGRENIYLNGAILGMTRADIRRKFDEIVTFAEVEKFLDTPVKRYSSGMYVRLAFAVAAHLEPEILVVDEVLAVGDADFQKKCLGKMDEVSRREGRTVLFVSHNMGTIANLCGRAIWLAEGLVREQGDARGLTSKYLSHRTRNSDRITKTDALLRPGKENDNRLRVEEIEWVSEWPLRQGHPAMAQITLVTKAPISELSVGLLFRNSLGTELLETCSDMGGVTRRDLPTPSRYCLTMEIESLPLSPDTYTLDIGCRSGDLHALDYIPFCAQIEVAPGLRTPPHTLQGNPRVQLTSAWSWGAVRV